MHEVHTRADKEKHTQAMKILRKIIIKYEYYRQKNKQPYTIYDSAQK